MGFKVTCDICGEDLDPDKAHFRARLQHWSDPVGEPPGPVGPGTFDYSEVLIHIEHLGEDPSATFLTMLKVEPPS